MHKFFINCEDNMKHAKLELRNSAIVVIDVQNYFVLPSAPTELPGASVAVDTIKTLLEIFRKKIFQSSIL